MTILKLLKQFLYLCDLLSVVSHAKSSYTQSTPFTPKLDWPSSAVNNHALCHNTIIMRKYLNHFKADLFLVI